MLLLDTGGDVHPLLFSEGVFPRKRLSVQAFQFCTSTVRRRTTKRIAACITDIVDDTVGVTAGGRVVLLGSFAEATCAALVVTASSDTLGNSWRAQRYPVLIFSLLEARWVFDSRFPFCALQSARCIWRRGEGIEKTLTIHTGVKRFRFGGSVVPATPSASGIHVTSFQIELVNDVYIRKNLYANGVCDRWHEHVPGGSGAHDEGTGGVSSICNEDQGGRSARPRCHDASVARKCCSSRKMFNFHMRLLGLLFYPLVGELPCPLHENLVVAAGVHRATVLIVAS